MRRPGRVVGLDLGSRRIGVAVSDDAQTVAAPVETIERGRDHATDHRTIAELVASYAAVGVVVGMPFSMSGAVGPAARAVALEVVEIEAAVAVVVDTVDERLTTVAAASALRRSGRRARQQRPIIDKTAAAMILQTWLDGNARLEQSSH